MSVIDELLKMDPACMPGSGHEFEHNLLIQECFGELEERVKALEDVTKAHSDHLTHQILCKPAPAPDLDALVKKYMERYHNETTTTVVELFYAFAEDLGCKP